MSLTEFLQTYLSKGLRNAWLFCQLTPLHKLHLHRENKQEAGPTLK